MEERRDAVLHEPSLERRMVASIEGQRQRASGVRNHGVFASSGDGSNRTPRSRTIELPSAGPNAMHGEGVLDQSRARVVTPGYSGHLPGESTRFGMSPTFHRPTSSSSRSSTPRGHHSLRDRTPSSPSVRLSRPTTAWEEIGVGAAARSTSPTRHHHHHHQQQQQYHGWSPRREYKHEVGGVVPGYTGHVPQGATLIGVSQTGGVRTSPARVSHMHSSGGFKSAEERRLAQRGHDHSPLRRGERSAGGSRGDRSHMSPIARSAERFASATVVGYTGHLPQDKEISGTSFWSPQGPANRDLGWRPRTSSSAIGRPPSPRAASPSSRDEQIRAARRQSVPVVTLSPNRNLRHAPDPNPSSWGGPATGPSSGWPHRAMDGTLIA